MIEIGIGRRVRQLADELESWLHSSGLAKLIEAVSALDQVRVSHCDWAGYLVHKSDPTQQVLEFDANCPKCVIDQVRAALRQFEEASR
jgi:hypothetical protein